MLLLELLVLVLTICLCLLLPHARRPAPGHTARNPLPRRQRRFARLRALAGRPAAWIVGVGAVTLVVQAGIGCLVHWPQPALHDEFSYLLAGDTFASGRMTNPTHPLWEHFESYNIIHQPSYQSKYPPGQGMVLAAGTLLAGAPIVGNWIVLALACAAVTWMAYAWLPPRWAPWAGVLLACNFHLLRFWGHSYMGGGVALLGGALLFGALPRIVRAERPRDAIWLGLGCVLLAFSRPYEGLLAATCAACVLAGWMLWRWRSSAGAAVYWPLLRRVVVPAASVLLCGGLWLGYYHFRVTGHPLKMPYQAWLETYGTEDSMVQVLLRSDGGQTEREVPVRLVGRQRTEADWQAWFRARSSLLTKLLNQWAFYVGLLLTPALCMLPLVARRDWMLLALLTCGLTLTAIFLQNTHGHPHYAAPVGCLLMVLLVQGLRGLQVWRVGRQRVGRRLSRWLPRVAVAICLVQVAVQWIPQPVLPPLAWGVRRARLEQLLEATGRKHVVIVHHPELQATGIHWEEWVYNKARIDDAQVVWARDLGAERNRNLVRYYADREVWLLDIQDNRLRAYGRPPAPPLAAAR